MKSLGRAATSRIHSPSTDLGGVRVYPPVRVVRAQLPEEPNGEHLLIRGGVCVAPFPPPPDWMVVEDAPATTHRRIRERVTDVATVVQQPSYRHRFWASADMRNPEGRGSVQNAALGSTAERRQESPPMTSSGGQLADCLASPALPGKRVYLAVATPAGGPHSQLRRTLRGRRHPNQPSCIPRSPGRGPGQRSPRRGSLRRSRWLRRKTFGRTAPGCTKAPRTRAVHASKGVRRELASVWANLECSPSPGTESAVDGMEAWAVEGQLGCARQPQLLATVQVVVMMRAPARGAILTDQREGTDTAVIGPVGAMALNSLRGRPPRSDQIENSGRGVPPVGCTDGADRSLASGEGR